METKLEIITLSWLDGADNKHNNYKGQKQYKVKALLIAYFKALWNFPSTVTCDCCIEIVLDLRNVVQLHFSSQFDLSSLSGRNIVLNGSQDLLPSGAQVLIIDNRCFQRDFGLNTVVSVLESGSCLGSSSGLWAIHWFIPKKQLSQTIWVESEASRTVTQCLHILYSNTGSMPQNCCVPECTKKGLSTGWC